MACTSGCPTQDHGSYAECLRAKSPRIAYCNSAGNRDATREKKWRKEIDRAYNVMSQGILPDNTFGPALDKAERISNETGVPYRADA